MKKKPLIVATVLLGAGLGYFFYRHITRRDASDATVYGNVDIRDVNVAFRVAGRVNHIAVDEGSAVKAGDVLATLDPEPFHIAVRSAESAVKVAQAKKTLLNEGFRKEEVEQSRAKLQAARTALSELDKQLARQKGLLPEGAASQRMVDNTQSLRDQAASQVRAAEADAHLKHSGFRQEERAESDAHLQQISTQLATARLALKDATLIAPSPGIILTRAIEKGSMVQVGTPAFTVSLTEPVWVRAYVSGAQLGRFAPGARLTLQTDARPGKPYHGVVGFVSPTAEFTPKSVETADLRTSQVYRIRVVVEDADGQLRQGMPVTLRLAS